jgi:aspartyl-tRNA(Asn)/glutamyl-tRNA(Gln) amidotransferase subunit C
VSLTAGDVNKIAYLARLGISPKDSDSYATDLSNILDLVAQMNQISTDNITPMAHPLDQVQYLRPDQVTEGNRRDHYQRCAAQIEAGLYLVPKVIE